MKPALLILTLILLILAWPRRRVIEPDDYESWRFV